MLEINTPGIILIKAERHLLGPIPSKGTPFIRYLRHSSYYVHHGDMASSRAATFYKPATDVIAGQRAVPFEIQIALFAVDPDGISVALATTLHSGCLFDIGDLIDLIAMAVFPNQRPREHKPFWSGYRCHFDINFYRFLIRHGSHILSIISVRSVNTFHKITLRDVGRIDRITDSLQYSELDS